MGYREEILPSEGDDALAQAAQWSFDFCIFVVLKSEENNILFLYCENLYSQRYKTVC